MFKLTRLSLKYLIFVMWGLCVAVAPSVAVGEEAEFLKRGLPLDSKKLNIKSKEKTKYKTALAKFPNAQSCVVKASSSEDLWKQPLDQSQIESLKELEVCAFRIAAALKNLDHFEEWIELSGFHVTGPHLKSDEYMKRYNRSQKGFGLNGALQRRDIDMNFGWFTLFGVYSLSFGILFDNAELPVNTGAIFTRE